MPGILSLVGAMTRAERTLLSLLLFFFLVSSGLLLQKFYLANTTLVPASGGTYIEGSVGELQPLIPWFTVTNDVNRDIISLVFSGLLRYNPETKRIEEDLATLRISQDGRTYELRLKENLFWHDSTEEQPHPVTADDVLFTFKTVQDSQFPNDLLRQNFRGVSIEKIDERTTRFRLEEPYSFFQSNLTLGILPARSFEGIPLSTLNQALDFGFQPIGAGPYRLHSIIQTDLSTEVTLERFPRSIPPRYLLNQIVFRIFPDYTTLLADLRTLDGIRLVYRNDEGELLVPKRFRARSYTLPQYVALFFNLDREIPQDQNLRLALQLGTNKQAIVDAIHESVIVDTPLLEIDVSDWRFEFDPAAAQGALFESNWHLPEKLRLQRLLEQTEANEIGILKIDPVVLLDTGAIITLTGSLQEVGLGSKVNGLPIQEHPTASGTWIVGLPTHGGTGALRLGENLIRLTGPTGKIVDSFYLWRTTDTEEYKRAEEEQRLTRLFRKSRAEELPEEQRITVQHLSLEKNMLRRRLSTDPISIRTNDRGDILSLSFLTSPAPLAYQKVAELIKKQWEQLGVHIRLEIAETREAFEERLLRRDYDVLLFGQSLLDNLDSYPYWHTIGRQKLTGKREDLRLDTYNLSQYSSFQADTLLETIRRTRDESERNKTLQALRKVLNQDVPAVFLYSPLYTFAHKQDLLGVELGSLSLHSDRFLTLHRWYVKQDRTFLPEKNWVSFFSWLPTLLSPQLE